MRRRIQTPNEIILTEGRIKGRARRETEVEEKEKEKKKSDSVGG